MELVRYELVITPARRPWMSTWHSSDEPKEIQIAKASFFPAGLSDNGDADVEALHAVKKSEGVLAKEYVILRQKLPALHASPEPHAPHIRGSASADHLGGADAVRVWPAQPPHQLLSPRRPASSSGRLGAVKSSTPRMTSALAGQAEEPEVAAVLRAANSGSHYLLASCTPKPDHEYSLAGEPQALSPSADADMPHVGPTSPSWPQAHATSFPLGAKRGMSPSGGASPVSNGREEGAIGRGHTKTRRVALSQAEQQEQCAFKGCAPAPIPGDATGVPAVRSGDWVGSAGGGSLLLPRGRRGCMRYQALPAVGHKEGQGVRAGLVHPGAQESGARPGAWRVAVSLPLFWQRHGAAHELATGMRAHLAEDVVPGVCPADGSDVPSFLEMDSDREEGERAGEHEGHTAACGCMPLNLAGERWHRSHAGQLHPISSSSESTAAGVHSPRPESPSHPLQEASGKPLPNTLAPSSSRWSSYPLQLPGTFTRATTSLLHPHPAQHPKPTFTATPELAIRFFRSGAGTSLVPRAPRAMGPGEGYAPLPASGWVMEGIPSGSFHTAALGTTRSWPGRAVESDPPPSFCTEQHSLSEPLLDVQLPAVGEAQFSFLGEPAGPCGAEEGSECVLSLRGQDGAPPALQMFGPLRPAPPRPLCFSVVVDPSQLSPLHAFVCCLARADSRVAAELQAAGAC